MITAAAAGGEAAADEAACVPVSNSNPSARLLMRVCQDQEQLCQLHRHHSEKMHDGSLLEQFLDASSSQLTVHGISELHRTHKEGSSCVFFRNNHFSVLHKYQGHLFVLVTDEGYTYEKGIVWEQLLEVPGTALGGC